MGSLFYFFLLKQNLKLHMYPAMLVITFEFVSRQKPKV